MGRTVTKTEQQRFETFTKELAELSRKHGFVLDVTGGVYIADPNDPELEKLYYTDDLGSGDLESRGWG